VKNFYTPDRMKAAAGPRPQKGCIGNNEDKSNQGVMASFNARWRQAGRAGDHCGREREGKKTDIFYARIDMTQPTPSPSR